MLEGAFAAAVTPLQNGGEALNPGAIAEYAAFLAEAGLRGVMVSGTAGEGLLLSPYERRQLAEEFIDASPPGFDVLVQCGAQTTAETVGLAAHAADVGATAALAICPPYFPLDESAQYAFFSSVASACASIPFGVYEFSRASGYSVSHDVLETLRAEHPNFKLIKISDTPWENFSPYLAHNLQAFCGPEGLIGEALAEGAVGVISALAAAFPHEVADAFRERDPARLAGLQRLRTLVDRFPRQAALKTVLREQGVRIGIDVRPPLRVLTSDEQSLLLEAVENELAVSGSRLGVELER